MASSLSNRQGNGTPLIGLGHGPDAIEQQIIPPSCCLHIVQTIPTRVETTSSAQSVGVVRG